MSTRRVTWGEGIVVAAFRHRGGIKAAVDRIHKAVGEFVGVRNSFAKLQRVESPDELNDKDSFRAWLLLTALQESPNEWGIADAAVPPGFDIERLRRGLSPSPSGPGGLPENEAEARLEKLADRKRAHHGAPRSSARYVA